MANDDTFPILDELGFRQSYCSIPGRYNPRYGQEWWGAFPYSHHTSRKSRLICGDPELYECPITRTLQPQPGPEPGTWFVRDRSTPRRKALEATLDAVRLLADRHGLEVVSASLGDIHREADRLSAY